MADISKIILPSGTMYNIKDEVARQAAGAGVNFIKCTDAENTPKNVTWDDGGTIITGELVASESTTGGFYLVPASTQSGKDTFAEYVTIHDNNTYTWEKIGTTDIDLSNLGALAYEDNVTVNVKPEGTVSKPIFSGSSMISTGKFTPEGTINTPTITVTPSTTTKYVANSVTGGGSVTSGSAASCTLPELSATVSNETLTLSWTNGSFTPNVPTNVTLPTFGSQVIVSDISSATSSQLTFTGSESDVSVTGTPSGDVSQPTFTGTQKPYIGS